MGRDTSKRTESTGPELFYWRGDAAEFTGKVLEIHGGMFYEIRLIEGHLTGETRVVSQRQIEGQ